MNKKHSIVAVVLLSGAVAGSAMPAFLGGEDVPEPLPVPNLISFVPNTQAKAEEVNSNFDALSSVLNSLRDSVLVAREKLNAFTGEYIMDGTVTAADLAQDALTAQQLGTDSVNSDEIGAGAVGSSELAEAAVVRGKIAPNAVSIDKLSTDSVDGSKIKDGSVALVDLQQNSVDRLTTVDEAGVASFTVDTLEENQIPDGNNKFMEKQVSFPAAGFVLSFCSLIMSGDVSFDDDSIDDSIVISFGLGLDLDDDYHLADMTIDERTMRANFVSDGTVVMHAGGAYADTLKFKFPISYHSVSPISAGQHTFRMIGKINKGVERDSDDPFQLFRLRMTLLYVPTAYDAIQFTAANQTPGGAYSNDSFDSMLLTPIEQGVGVLPIQSLQNDLSTLMRGAMEIQARISALEGSAGVR